MLSSCESFLAIEPPINNLTSSTAFLTDEDIKANIAGLHSYNLLSSSYHDLYRHAYLDLSADVLRYYTTHATFDQLVANDILTNNSSIQYFWTEPYRSIYQSNMMLVQLENASPNVSADLRNEGLGISHFFRAFSYINLVTVFGDVPLITEADVKKTDKLPRSPMSDVYDLVIEDLKEAKNLLRNTKREHGWVSQAAATALLARAYLYTGQWDAAAREATEVIAGNAGKTYVLEDLEKAFLRSSGETIFAISTDGSRLVNYTYAGRDYVANTQASYYFTDEFLAAFENGDLRKANWTKQFTAKAPYNWYPYKLKQRTTPSDASLAEDQVLIRLAELYLIRAEASAQAGNLAQARADLNAIRQRAGLSDLPASLSKEQMLLAVEQERWVELFCEYGHRWVDLVRTGRIDAVLGAHKSSWKPWAQLYPIHYKELELNPNLTQNPGYDVQ